MDQKEFIKYFHFAEENNIKVFPIPQTNTGNILKIAIEKNGKIKLGENKYTPMQIENKIRELYKQIYLKNQKK